VDLAALTRAAGASEALVHGRPSGVDVALAIAGGVGVFRRATGLVPLTGVPPLRVLVGPSGAPRSTAAMIDRVAETTGGRSDDARLRELGALTDTATAALRAGDRPALGAAMDRAHGLLADLGVSTPALDALCEAARAAGASGAKLTGAGGGGAVIAVAPPGREPAILAAWKQAGVDGFVATVR
jgi:mevalonate kinase